jgi:signal transduction histidine kinase
MAVKGVEDTQTVEHQAALLRVALLVARDAPQEELFQAAAEETARLFGAESGSVVRYVGAERAVIVGVWRARGRRGLPVNAEVDFEPGTTAMGQARATRGPVRAVGYDTRRGQLAELLRSIGLTAGVAAPVQRGGDVWGALVAGAADEETLPPGSEQRLRGLAELIGQALDNDDRRAELAASRTRLVQAGDEARRRLERALHEGAHQHVVALALKLRVALGRAEPHSEMAEILRDLLADAMETSAELSDLARGLHPAVLTERGLAAALQALTARCTVAVSIEELPGRRFADFAETTAYLIASEALTNVAAHSHATECTLRAADRGDRLDLEIRDNGIGGATPRPGGGLECLADRADAIGARFTLISGRGGGTTVRVEIPVAR